MSLLLSGYVTQVQHDGWEEWSACGALTQPGHHKFRQVRTPCVSLVDLDYPDLDLDPDSGFLVNLDPDLTDLRIGFTITVTEKSIFSVTFKRLQKQYCGSGSPWFHIDFGRLDPDPAQASPVASWRLRHKYIAIFDQKKILILTVNLKIFVIKFKDPH